MTSVLDRSEVEEALDYVRRYSGANKRLREYRQWAIGGWRPKGGQVVLIQAARASEGDVVEPDEVSYHPTTSGHPGTRKALAALLTLASGWYLRADLAKVLAAHTGITENWAESLLTRAGEEGALSLRTVELTVHPRPGQPCRVQRVFVHVDSRLPAIWSIDKSRYDGPALPISPLLPDLSVVGA